MSAKDAIQEREAAKRPAPPAPAKTKKAKEPSEPAG